MEGTLYTYEPKTRLSLFAHANALPSTPARTILLFVGGMYDSHTNTPYLSSLATVFRTSTTTRLIHPLLSSHGRHFGISSLTSDVRDLATCIKYLLSSSLATHDTKIILLGHSTGCQDVLFYLTSSIAPNTPPRPQVHGAILQAPVSDRDGLLHAITDPTTRQKYDSCIDICNSTPDSERRTTLLPMHLTKSFFGPVPMSVARFWSLASPTSPERPEDDDMFSSDCTPSRLRDTFGKAVSDESPLQPLQNGTSTGRKTLCVLLSGADEYYPPHLDATSELFLPRWRKTVEEGGGAMSAHAVVVKGAKHDLGGETEEARKGRTELCRRIVEYMRELLGAEAVEDVVWDNLKRMKTTGDGGEIDKGVGGLKL